MLSIVETMVVVVKGKSKRIWFLKKVVVGE
jgi:hypothetical protein